MTRKEELENKVAELKKKKHDLEALANIQDVFQHSYKIYLNSVYGFTGTQYSPVFSTDLAEAVTSTGRATIQEMVRFTNKALTKIDAGATGIDQFVVAGDTDSLIGTTKIRINNLDDITFEDLFNELSEDMPIFKLENGKEMIDVEGWYRWINKVNPWQTNSQFGLSDIKNVVRHKVTKDKWKITIDDDSVEVTKDHSIMVYRDGYVIECKPEEIKKTDYLIKKKH